MNRIASTGFGIGVSLCTALFALTPGPRLVESRAIPADAEDPAREGLRPLSLASADFDGDGIPDLAAGYAGEGDAGGRLVLLRGNPDALYPWSPEARRRRAEGRFVAEPFLPTGVALALPAPPDLLLAGDFDADGRADLASFELGGSAVLFARGDGHGGFEAARAIPLPGAVTAAAAGETGRRDGLPDIAVIVSGPSGERALVLAGPDGAVRAAPRAIPLPARADEVSLADADGDGWGDLVVGEAPAAAVLSGRSGRWLGAEELARGGNSLAKRARAGEDDDAAELSARVGGDGASGAVVLKSDGSLAVLAPAAVSTFTVDSTADTNDAAPGDGVCAAAGGECSLRAAIQEANAHAGADAIAFAIPGSGVPQISTPGLPPATETITIDGTTQSAGKVMVTGTTNGTVITLAANGCLMRGIVMNGTGNNGLKIQGDDNVVEGNFFGTTADGTALQGGIFGPNVYVVSGANNLVGGTAAAARNVVAGGSYGVYIGSGPATVQGNYIGTDVTGTLDLGSATQGVRAFTGGDGNTIGGTAAGAGNLISGEGQAGIELDSDGNLVQGNRIGTDAAGTSAIPNATYGIDVNFSVDNTIGGTAVGAGNLVSGNLQSGIRLDAGGVAPITNTIVQGNRIGTNADGSAALPNQGHGIHVVAGTNVQIGGSSAAARNLISGNLFDGIFITKFATVYSTNLHVQGNYIGTDATGTVAIPNLQSGIEFEYAHDTLIGGTGAGEGNVISGNQDHGVRFDGGDASATPNLVVGNLIGTNAFGTGPLGNEKAGVYFNLSSPGFDAGGAGAGEPNVIAYNGGAGIASASGRPVRFRRNVVHSNGGLGIDRGSDGVTPNQTPGTFVYENFPILTDASTSASGTSVSGTLSSGYALAYTVHVFANPTCDPSGYGEARTYLGSLPVNTTAGADTPFSTTFPTPLPAGSYVTALAVAPDDASNVEASSELSFCRQVSGGAPPGSVALEVLAVAPGRGGDTGNVTLTITGQGIVAGATVKLVRAGQSDIAGTSVSVDPSGASLTAVFALIGAAHGAWDVVVTNPGPASSALAAAFLVESATEPDVWADILGRGLLVVRAGREQTFFVVYGNRGNVDSEPVELRLSIPRQLKVTFIEEQDGTRPLYTLDKPTATGGSGESGINFYVRSIPAGSSRVFAFRVLTVEADPGEYGQEVEMSLWFMSDPDLASIVDAPHDSSVVLTPSFLVNDPGHFAMDVDVAGNSGSGTIHVDLTTADAAFEAAPTATKTVSGNDVKYVVQSAFTNSPTTAYTLTVEGPQEAINAALLYDRLMTSNQEAHDKQAKGQMLLLAGLIDANGNATLENFRDGANATHIANFATWFAPTPLVPAGQINALDGVMQKTWENNVLAAAYSNPAAWQDFLQFDNASGLTGSDVMRRLEEKLTDPKIRARILRPLRVYLAIDPNEKAGPGGATDAHYVSGAAPLPYTITFENVETASAAAQEVVVTDQLDLSKLDASTFELGPITFGTRVVEVPNGLTTFTTDVDLRPDVDLIARVTAGFNAETGVATWHFFSIDPATGQPTTDALLGFLPPNVATPEGEGHVSFTVRAKTGQASGTEIHNQASIVFDANAPILTADWLNTLDVTAPSSQVAALPASGCTGNLVQWSGSDAHSGIVSYDVYVSENGAAFAPWLTGATATSATYYGIAGNSYGFYSVARDAAGNVEAPPGIADATTFIDSSSPLVDVLTPSSGPASGGTSVAVTGSGFESGAALTVGGTPATGVTVHDPTSITATFPVLTPGTLYDVAAANPSGCGDTLAKGWLADFSDVDGAHPFHDFIEKIFRHGVTAGCSGGNYCPANPVTRAQMAVFLIKAKYGLSLVPPAATGTLFNDVPAGSFAADWIESLAHQGVTGGCGGGNYCPGSSVTRAQMAVFLLKSEHGALFTPPPATGVFPDVPASDPFAPWIEQLAVEGITGGCGGGNYCPASPVTRGQMAVFLSKTFGF